MKFLLQLSYNIEKWIHKESFISCHAAALLLQNTLLFEEPVVNLTPLIDVVFVILIMFIVIAPLLELDRIELADGPAIALASVQSAQESSPITIHVYRDNTIRYDSKPISLPELKALLIQAKKRFPDAIPQVFHDKSAHFGVYQEVKNGIEEAGFSKMDIILKPD